MKKSIGQVRTTAALVLALLLATVGVAADEVTLKAGHPDRYVVKKGDTLWKIAEHYYGDGSLYKDIFEANKDVLRDPNVIKVGQKLKIP